MTQHLIFKLKLNIDLKANFETLLTAFREAKQDIHQLVVLIGQFCRVLMVYSSAIANSDRPFNNARECLAPRF
jgi:hypothetical protein